MPGSQHRGKRLHHLHVRRAPLRAQPGQGLRRQEADLPREPDGGAQHDEFNPHPARGV